MLKRLSWLWICLVLPACVGLAEHAPLPTASPLRPLGNVPTPPVRAANAAATRAPFATPLPPAPPAVAPRIPHSLIGKADCVSCHTAAQTTFRMPPSHNLRGNAMCLGCHHVDASVLQPTPKAARHTAAAGEACLLCHLKGEGGARAVPAGHAGRMNDTCRACHLLK